MRKSQSLKSIPAAGEGKRGQQGYLGYLLRQAAAAHRLRMERALADLGVTMPQFLVLTMLKAYPGASNADLARLTQLTPQTLSVIVANLLKSGAVARQAHAEHGRIQMIRITEAGLSSLEECRRRVHPIEEALQSGFSDDEQAIVRRWLVAAAIDPHIESEASGAVAGTDPKK
ncbi:MAG TPA: MarR family transcriptional regulator [Candidatus Sulfotelmatobacter sp.]|jgi:DNA-binding MarR family transcriptional regulator|nr:MarR family transcriptional regulator [Candidatus Sulfotelmatobacter sp.]